MKLRAPFFAWPALAVIAAVLLGCGRPEPKAVAPAPAAVVPVVPVVRAAPSAPAEPRPYETPRPTGTREATPLPNLRTLDPADPSPKAGRQVLRCIDNKGRITYLDLNATCPDGAGERVTVFPTEGVERPR